MSLNYDYKYNIGDEVNGYIILEQTRTQPRNLKAYKVQCIIHNDYIIITTENNLNSGSGCKYCGYDKKKGIKSKYLYNISQIVNDNYKILEQTIKKRKDGWNQKAYKVKCIIDGYETIVPEYNLKTGQKCVVCSGKKVFKGVTDMWTTAPHIAKLLKNPKEGFLYTKACNKKVMFKCPICGFEKILCLNDVYRQGFSCSKCSDGITIPNKIIRGVALQLNKNCLFEYQIKENKKYKYDCFIPYDKKSIIIEIHGRQHYSKSCFECKGGKTLKEEQENDSSKRELALINQYIYIEINAEKSELEYIKNNIINSDLKKYFDLSNIDWNKVFEYCNNSLMVSACKHWNDDMSIIKIANHLKLHRRTIRQYLKNGNTLGLCVYSKEISEKRRIVNANINKINTIKVICIDNNIIFNSVKEVNNYYQIKNKGDVSAVCKGKKKHIKKHVFMYYDEYLKASAEEIVSRLNYKSKHNTRKIVCLNDNKIFESIIEAEKYYKIGTSKIIEVCKGKKIHVRGYKFRYFEDVNT